MSLRNEQIYSTAYGVNSGPPGNSYLLRWVDLLVTAGQQAVITPQPPGSDHSSITQIQFTLIINLATQAGVDKHPLFPILCVEGANGHVES